MELNIEKFLSLLGKLVCVELIGVKPYADISKFIQGISLLNPLPSLA